MGIPDRLTCLLRNLNAGKEATVRTRHGKMDWFKVGKGVYQGGILLIYILYRPHHVKCWTGIKIYGRNINNLRYIDDNIVMAESEEEQKSLLIRVKKDSEKCGLNSAFKL